MKYLLLICFDESIEVAPGEGSPDAWIEATRGVRLDGSRLRPPADATTVRVRRKPGDPAAEEVLVSDGPFAETKELIVGYDVIECENLDEALNAAALHPVARFGAVEVRPFWTGEDAEGK
ncbi:YciI family protein [Streptomyces hoynatensis]|uniref:YCII-related domain-containing protein n=1 Tax=Streptomyces hoynatensis TaxID=1141874 RepID=A0A3A9ZIX0_9ACTN|nr:YciI family protein [Streptomyces hoynatensis]RKN47156.1 hypothetical protein D7294_03005 [Streptomyces hoynatensis]